MISSVAELLQCLIEKEAEQLSKVSLKHAPTIGAMYEGLTKDVLERAIPINIGLQLVNGFIIDDDGGMSPQVDCMLVKNRVQKIPHTDHYKCHVKDVIAVIEVKKSLYSADLRDAYWKLFEVQKLFRNYIQSDNAYETPSMASALKSFAMVTKRHPPAYKDADTLSFPLEMIYHELVMARIVPIGIILGYGGFKTEYNLREGVFKFLSSYRSTYGLGVGGFAQLTTTGAHSIVKLNGQPYNGVVHNGWWPFLGSARVPAINLILELIWTRLAEEYDLAGLWGEDRELEAIHPCIWAKAAQTDQHSGWEYRFEEVSAETLADSSPYIPWSPAIISEQQKTILLRLCMGRTESIDDPTLVEYVQQHGQSIEGFTSELLDTGLIAMRGSEFVLTTEKCEIASLPDGRTVAAENNTGRLTRWITATYT